MIVRKNEGVVSKEHFNESRKIKKLCATALSKSERLARTTDLLGSEGRFVHKHKMEFFFENFLNTEVQILFLTGLQIQLIITTNNTTCANQYNKGSNLNPQKDKHRNLHPPLLNCKHQISNIKYQHHDRIRRCEPPK